MFQVSQSQFQLDRSLLNKDITKTALQIIMLLILQTFTYHLYLLDKHRY